MFERGERFWHPLKGIHNNSRHFAVRNIQEATRNADWKGDFFSFWMEFCFSHNAQLNKELAEAAAQIANLKSDLETSRAKNKSDSETIKIQQNKIDSVSAKCAAFKVNTKKCQDEVAEKEREMNAFRLGFFFVCKNRISVRAVCWFIWLWKMQARDGPRNGRHERTGSIHHSKVARAKSESVFWHGMTKAIRSQTWWPSIRWILQNLVISMPINSMKITFDWITTSNNNNEIAAQVLSVYYIIVNNLSVSSLKMRREKTFSLCFQHAIKNILSTSSRAQQFSYRIDHQQTSKLIHHQTQGTRMKNVTSQCKCIRTHIYWMHHGVPILHGTLRIQ